MTKISILKKEEGIIENNSYDHRAYESVDGRSISMDISQKSTENKILGTNGLIQTRT